MNLRTHAEQLRQMVLVRLARQEKSPIGELGVGGDVAGSGTQVATPSPSQVLGASSSLTGPERKQAERDQYAYTEQPGEGRKKVQQVPVGDRMVPPPPAVGRPSDVTAWISDDEGHANQGNILRGALMGLSRDTRTKYGKVASKKTAEFLHVLGHAADHYDCLAEMRHHFSDPEWQSQHHLSSTAPVYARMGELKELMASIDDKNSAKYKAASKEYEGWARGIAQLDAQNDVVFGKEKGVPFYPTLNGESSEPSSAATTAGDTEGDDPEGDEPEGGKKSEETRRTELAKDAKHGAAVALNSPVAKLLGAMRKELADDLGESGKKKANFKDKLRAERNKHYAEVERRFTDAGRTKKAAAEEAKRTWGERQHAIIEKQRQKLLAYGALEEIVSSHELASHSIAAAGNESLKNFASWYSTGATRTLAAISDLVNTSPVFKSLKGKLGSVVPYTAEDGSTRHRLQFNSKEEAQSAVMMASLIGPTSANEKPSNNVRIALSILEDGVYQWHQKHANDPEKLKRGPSIMECLALAKHDRAHLGMHSEFGGQQSYKYLSGLYHALPSNDQLRLAPTFGALLMTEKQRSNITDPVKIQQELLKENKGLYHDRDGVRSLVPMKTGKLGGTAYKQHELFNYIKKAAKIDGSEHDAALREILDLAKQHTPEGRYVGTEGAEGMHAPEKVYRADGTAMPKALSSRPGSAIQYMNLMKMFNHAADVAEQQPEGATEPERKEAISNALMDYRGDDGKSLFDRLGLSDAALLDMYPDVDKGDRAKEAAKLHADNLAEVIARMPRGMERDAIGALFLAGTHSHDILRRVIPVTKNTWFTGGDDEPYAYHGVDDAKRRVKSSLLHGMTVLGPKFGPYALGVASPAISAMVALMDNLTPPAEKYVADRVMMELHSDAIGRRFGGTPESEFQRAAFNLGVKNLGKFLGKIFRGGALDIGKIQAITWGATQAAVSALGGTNPTEQLYTGAERAFALHKVHARRFLQHYQEHPELVTPEIKHLMGEYQHFVDHAQPLRARTMEHNIAYANLDDVPYVKDAGALGKESEDAKARTLEGMAKAGKKVTRDLHLAGKKAKLYQRGGADDTGRHGAAQAVRAAGGEDQRQAGRAGGRQRFSRDGAGKGDVPPAPALAGRASPGVQRGGSARAGRHAAPAGASDVPAAPGAGHPAQSGRVAKYSSQFMRSMLLGTSATAQAFRKQLDGIAKQIGVSVKSFNGVGDGTSESVPATAHISPQALDEDTTRYLAAWAGLLGGRKSVMMFHPDASGQDSLYGITLPLTDMQDVRAALNRRGIQHRTIIPGGTTSHVVVYDPMKMMRASVAQLAEEHDGHVLESNGRAEFIGRPTNSPGADADADAREHYRRIIADYEERRGIPNQAGAAADGGGGGSPVPAASNGRSPAGGSIVRGMTYKGGAFTPGAEQKAPPARQMGSPERYSRSSAPPVELVHNAGGSAYRSQYPDLQPASFGIGAAPSFATGSQHMPGAPMLDRVRTYPGADQAVKRIASDAGLHAAERNSDIGRDLPDYFERRQPNQLIARISASLKGEPSRVSRLLGHLGAPEHGGDEVRGMAHRIASLYANNEPLVASLDDLHARMGRQASPVALAREIGHAAQQHVPGVAKAVWEHMFAHGLGTESRQHRLDRTRDALFAPLDAPWASDRYLERQARRVHPVALQHGSLRLDAGHGNEYFASMLHEFFARPVKMAREHPDAVKFILGIMNGALRSH